MLTVTPLMLRDLVRKTQQKNGHSLEEVAQLCDCSTQAVRNFLSGAVSEPTGDIGERYQDYVEVYGKYSRGKILSEITPRRRTFTEKEEVHTVLQQVRALVASGEVTRQQLRREAGLPNGSMAGILKLSGGKKMTHNIKKLQDWLARRTPTGEQVLREAGVFVEMGKKEAFALSSVRPGRHYLCAYLDDREAAALISAIMTAGHMGEEAKLKMLGKLFAQEFPTLS